MSHFVSRASVLCSRRSRCSVYLAMSLHGDARISIHYPCICSYERATCFSTPIISTHTPTAIVELGHFTEKWTDVLGRRQEISCKVTTMWQWGGVAQEPVFGTWLPDKHLTDVKA